MTSITAFPQGRDANRTRRYADPPNKGGEWKTAPKSEEEDNRGRANLFAAVAVIVLLAVGWWMVNSFIETEKTQGCYASGARYCSLI
jgi:hypothetical protein